MKSLNHNIKPYIIFLMLVLLAFLFFLLSSCNPQKALIRKQDKAYGMTISTPRTFQQAAQLWLTIHPCSTPTIKDSTIIKHDTIRTESKVFIPITKYQTRNIDTIIDNISLYVDGNGITLKNLNEKEVVTKTIYLTKFDETKVNNLTDSLNASKITSSTKDGIIQEKAAQLSEQKKTSNKLKWYLGGSFVLLILSHIIRSYAKGMFSSVKNLFVKS